MSRLVWITCREGTARAMAGIPVPRASKAHVSKRRWNVNLRPVHAKVNGQGKRIRVCTSCLRSGKVVKA